MWRIFIKSQQNPLHKFKIIEDFVTVIVVGTIQGKIVFWNLFLCREGKFMWIEVSDTMFFISILAIEWSLCFL